MSQSNYNIPNQSAPAVRAQLNAVFGSIATNNSGSAAPSTTFAYQWWYDTTTNILKMRNGANSGWINFAEFDQGAGSFNILTETASQAEAEAGTDNTKLMTALRTAEAIATLGGLGDINIQSFTSSGTYTPTAGYKRALVFLTGGGGGGDSATSSSGSSGSGCSAATVIGVIDLEGLPAQSVTIGGGGSGSTSGPTAGGQSVLGSLMTANGAGASTTGGATGGTGGFVVPGADSNDSGDGAASFWGGGGRSNNTSGGSARAYGAGGGAPTSTPSSGTYNAGSGKSGVALVIEFK